MSALPPIATLIALFGVSALGQKQTFALQKDMSASKPSFPWRRPPLVNRTIGLVPVSRQNRCPQVVRFTPLVATNPAASIFGSSLCASLSFMRRIAKIFSAPPSAKTFAFLVSPSSPD
jgi:hypothetical protein